MADYIEPPIVTDAEDLAALAFDYIEANYPGWEANPANFETIVTEAYASIVSDAKDTARAQANEQFRAFGVSVAGVAADDAAPATINSTWTVQDAAGYTIPAGTQVGIPGTDGLVIFANVDDVVIPPASTSTAVGGVTLEATVPGAEANGLSGAPSLIDTLAYVTAIALVGVTANGTTAETETEYRDKLAREYRIMSPRPILPQDFAVLYVNRIAGVARARAIDGYNPTGPLFNQERTVAVVGIDAAGAALSPAIKSAGDVMLTKMREINFLVHIIDPTFVNVAIDVTLMARPNYVGADVLTRVRAALNEYLSPATWGSPLYSDETSSPGWNDEVTVRLYEIAEVVNRVDGVAYITALTINGAAADLVMTGVAPLPRVVDPVGDIDVVVNTP